MVSLKLSKKEREQRPLGAASSLGDEYPYGTRITLEGNALKQLFPELPKVGATMSMECAVKVVSVRQSANESMVELQITEAEIENDATEEAEEMAVGEGAHKALAKTISKM